MDPVRSFCDMSAFHMLAGSSGRGPCSTSHTFSPACLGNPDLQLAAAWQNTHAHLQAVARHVQECQRCQLADCWHVPRQPCTSLQHKSMA